MFGIGEKLRSAAAAGGALALAGAVAVVGLVWLSIAAYFLLSAIVPPAGAAAIIGAAALAPCLVLLLRQWPRAKLEPEPAASLDPDGSALVRLAQSAAVLAEKSPLLGAALTLGAAFLAARSPSTSPLAAHMLAEAVERWSRASPARTDADEPAPDA